MRAKFNVNTKINSDMVLDKLKEVLFNCMVKMEELAITYAPVDTGRLKTSIFLNPRNPGYRTYFLSDAVQYGIHQEYGTAHQKGTPFMRPAIDQVKLIWLKRYFNKAFK